MPETTQTQVMWGGGGAGGWGGVVGINLIDALSNNVTQI